MKPKTINAMREAAGRRRGRPQSPSPATNAERLARAKKSLVEAGGWRSGISLGKPAHDAVKRISTALGGIPYRAAIEVVLLYCDQPGHIAALQGLLKENGND